MMRALYRWELGVRLGATALALLALTWMVKRTRTSGTKWIPMVLAGLMVLEAVPNPVQSLLYQRQDLQVVRGVESELTTPLSGLLPKGSITMLYGPGGSSPGSNDYMANFICGVSDLKCYNAGGDTVLGDRPPRNASTRSRCHRQPREAW